uniref:Solute carrier family 22 member 15-like n=1 Tax=Phallusia mammillata TaxID=59560 RepID=A0A6F9DRQ7_9ASCI|nr:solute carrier family 22 member 15-like [Phallusia mammillata]
MDIDDCFSKVVGTFGKYQLLTYAILSIYQIILTFHSMLVIFIGLKPQNLKSVNSRVSDDCSILTEWNLLDYQWASDLIQSLYFCGSLIGVVSFGQLSDRYGRRPVLQIGFSLLLAACFFTAFAPSWKYFALGRFLTGFFQGGAALVNYVYLQEIVGRSWWAITGAVCNIQFSIGLALLAIFAYFIPSWRYLAISVTLPQLIPLFYAWTIPESPRWLYSKGRVKEAELTLLYIAKRNGVKIPHETTTNLISSDDDSSIPARIKLASKTATSNDKSPVVNKSAIDLFRHPVTAQRTVIMLCIWFVNGLVYFAMSLAAGDIGSNIYVSVALSGLIEIPSTFVCTALLEKRGFGRKGTTAVFMIVTSVACFSVVQASNTLSTLVLGLTGKMMIAASINAISVYTPELFPTSVRNVALGSCSMAARVGGILASMLKSVVDVNRALGYSLFGISSLAGGLLSLQLVETLGSKPPDSFEDLDHPDEQSPEFSK